MVKLSGGCSGYVEVGSLDIPALGQGVNGFARRCERCRRVAVAWSRVDCVVTKVDRLMTSLVEGGQNVGEVR